MVEKLKNDFQDWYKRAFEESRNYTNPNPIMKFAGEVSLYGKDAMTFLRRIEQDLLDRNIVDKKYCVGMIFCNQQLSKEIGVGSD